MTAKETCIHHIQSKNITHRNKNLDEKVKVLAKVVLSFDSASIDIEYGCKYSPQAMNDVC